LEVHWVKLDKACLDQNSGGLRVRRVHEFNLSLLHMD